MKVERFYLVKGWPLVRFITPKQEIAIFRPLKNNRQGYKWAHCHSTIKLDDYYFKLSDIYDDILIGQL